MKEFNNKIQSQFDWMCKSGKLFRVELTGDQIWDLYIKSFDSDPVFRDPASSTHNCNLCNNFIRRYGNIVSINEFYGTSTMFDVEIEGEFAPVAKALSSAIKSSILSEGRKVN